MRVGLEAVAELGLHDPVADLEVVHEPAQPVAVLAVELLGGDGGDPAQQHGTEARRGVGGQVAATERDATRRRDRPVVEHLELGQEHEFEARGAARPCWRRLAPPGWRGGDLGTSASHGT